MRCKGSLVFVLDLFGMGLTSAEGQKPKRLNEMQLIFESVQRKSGNPLSIKVMLILYLHQALSLSMYVYGFLQKCNCDFVKFRGHYLQIN
jgi:hypothetical protein